MAHSFIQAHDDEGSAFARFADVRPRALTLPIDSDDTERGAAIVAALAPRLAAVGITVRAVRIDGGDHAAHARAVRAILDRAGLRSIRIIAGGGLDEHGLLACARAGAPIDGYGIGGSLATADGPLLDCAYELQEYAGRPRRKRSEEKASPPGRKQVWRHYAADGSIASDRVALLDEPDDAGPADGEPLPRPVMRGGWRLAGLPDLRAARAHAASGLARLPPALRSLDPAAPKADGPVEIGAGVRRLSAALRAALGAALGAATAADQPDLHRRACAPSPVRHAWRN